MLLPIDSSEYNSTVPFTQEAINCAIEMQFKLPSNKDNNRFIVTSYFLLKILQRSLSINEILSMPLFDGENSLFNNSNTDSDIIATGKEYLTNEIWKNLIETLDTINFFDLSKEVKEKNINILKRIASFKYKDYFSRTQAYTPDYILELIKNILDINENDTNIADICCGSGSFFSYILNDKKETQQHLYTGYEIDTISNGILKIKKEFFDDTSTQLKIIKGDFFENALKDKDSSLKYNKIFSHYPFLGFKENPIAQEYAKTLEGIPDKLDAACYDWIYYHLIYQLLDKDNGKAVIIIPYGNSVNDSSSKIREYFVENNMIEAVIKLPDNILYETGIQLSLLVLTTNKKKNTIRLIDASNIFENSNHKKRLNKEDIELITNLYKGEEGLYNIESKSCICIDVTQEEAIIGRKLSSLDKTNLVRQKQNVLQPVKLNASFFISEKLSTLSAETPFVPLGSVIKGISRGSHCTAKELEAMASKEKTSYSYVLLNNIEDGMIDENLLYISPSEKDKKHLEKYFLKNNEIIISKIGPSYKAALIQNLDKNKNILATGNMYIIEIDAEKIVPGYLFAYILSKPGQRSLFSITKGVSIPIIGMSDLLDLEIPLPSKEKQLEFSKKCSDLLSNIKKLKNELMASKEELYNIFGESVKDNFDE